jgi:hypothetical protein
MSGLGSIQESVFSIERYQSKISKFTVPIQIALVVISGSGIVLSLLSHFGYLDRSFIYIGSIGSGAAALGLIALKITQKNQLRAAVNDAKSFSYLKSVLNLVKVREPCFSFTNCTGATNNLEVYSSKLDGCITSSELDTIIDGLENSDKFSTSKDAVLQFQTKLNDWIYSGNSHAFD